VRRFKARSKDSLKDDPLKDDQSKGDPLTDDSPAESGRGGDKTTEIAAVRLLARREHSTRDLKRKLQGKGHAEAAVERVVDKLVDKKLVSDERFATSFVAYHGRRGHGPIRIRAELRQQGADDEVINSALAAAEFDWNEVAIQARRRKFGDERPRNLSERAKQARFLQYRGFSSDHIRAAMAHTAVDLPLSADPQEPALPDPDFDDSN
jgi:regulatory protein